MKGILGLWDGHDASASLLVDGELVFALSEERPSRRKRYSGFPRMALREALRWAEAGGVEISDVAIAGRTGRAPHRLIEPFYRASDPHRDPLSVPSRAIERWDELSHRLAPLGFADRAAGLIPLRRRVFSAMGAGPKIHLVDHHEAHAYSALFAKRREPGLVITWDAYGDGLAMTARLAEEPTGILFSRRHDAGVASLYGAITVALGFKEGDEGKVMGLAAKGSAERSAGRFLSLFERGDGEIRLRRRLNRRLVAALLERLSIEDACAGLQAAAESLAEEAVRRVIASAGGGRPLLLAGGLFANVKLNQALARMPEIDGLYVFPNMGDGGLSSGAAHALWHRLSGRLAEPLETALLGLDAKSDSIEAALSRAGLAATRPARVADVAAGHLAAGRVVCCHRGRDEFGPRALGARSIFFSPAVEGLDRRVNAALGRDDIMPFAPVLPEEEARSHLREVSPGVDLEHMTVAADASDKLAARCPTAVHVDGTARPQLVGRRSHPFVHELLLAFREKTGLPALINTSFNLHGEPIVHTPCDAVSTFARSGLDVLVLGDLVASRRL